MSHRKSINTNKPIQSASNSKTNIDTHHKHHKPTPYKHTPPQVSQPRNLMEQFQKEQQKEVTKSHLVLQSEQSDINESSSIGSRIIHDIDPSPPPNTENYKFQLPRSYIIAMTALQQAVKQRDLEITNIQKELSTINDAKARLKQQNEEAKLKEKQLKNKLIQLTAETKLLRESIQKQRQNNISNNKIISQLEVQLAIIKQNRRSESSSFQIQINHIKSQLSKSQMQNQSLKSEINKARIQIEKNSRELDETKIHHNQFRINFETENKSLQKQLQIQYQKRVNADKQIQILRKQLSLLAQRTVIAQTHHQKSLHHQKTYINSNEGEQRAPLNEIIRVNSALIHQSTLKPHSMINLETKGVRIDQKTLLSQIPKHFTHHKKGTQSSLLNRERSSSRMKVRQNCPELISQYRELLRHQKQLVALNYQLQILEKGLAGGGQVKGELQRNYQKIKRQCEQKEMQIRELKTFLNDPLK